MTWLIGVLGSVGLSKSLAEKVAPWVAGSVAVLLLVLAFVTWDYFDDRAAIKQDRLEGNNTALKAQLEAAENAAAERIRNNQTTQAEQEAYNDAIENPKAGDSDDPGVRLACERLRRSGQDTTTIPECGRR